MTPNGKPKLIQDARDFVTTQHFGVLATHSVRRERYPMGSVVPYDIDESGRIIIYISLIAEHYKNLLTNPRASLTVLDPFGFEDPQAFSRAAILLDFSEVPEGERESVQKSYAARFPKSKSYDLSHNFCFFRGTPTSVRWIAGFGEMGWIAGDEFSRSEPGPLSYRALGILSHMNHDHRDALRELALASGERSGERGAIDPGAVQMVSLTSQEFVIEISRAHGKSERIVIPFPQELSSPDEVRKTMIELIKKARELLQSER